MTRNFTAAASAAALLSLTLWTPLAAEPATPTPTPLSETASAPARLAEASPPPFVLPASSAKLEIAAGAKQARMEAKVAAGKPAGVLFTAPGGDRMFWLMVSSPKSDVWMAVWDTKAKKWVTGTNPKAYTSRLTVSFDQPTELLLVAITDSPETPFRFEVNLGAIGL
jgi:hypothetical protein